MNHGATQRRLAGVNQPIVIAASIVAWAGVLLQLYLSIDTSVGNGKTILNGLFVYFGYFTVLTNIIVALVLTLPLVLPRTSAGRFAGLPGIQTAVASAISLVGIAYHLLLRQIWDPQGAQLVADVLLHYVTPAFFVVVWFVTVPKSSIRFAQIPAWTTYLLAYFIYMLVRGLISGAYPYPFLDVNELGLGRVALNAVGVSAGFVFIAALLCLAARIMSRNHSAY